MKQQTPQELLAKLSSDLDALTEFVKQLDERLKDVEQMEHLVELLCDEQGQLKRKRE